jgi:hypothetical protein
MISDIELDNLRRLTIVEKDTINQEIYFALTELKERREKEAYEINFDKELSIIVNYYKDRQIIKLVEEMAELTQAIMKNIYSNEKEDCESILQEIADVEILLRQLFLRRKKDDQARINGIKNFKIKRTLKQIYEESNKERNKIDGQI